MLAYTYVRTLPDFTTAIQSRNETTRKSTYVSTSAENGPAMAGPAGPVPAPMSSFIYGCFIYSTFNFDLLLFAALLLNFDLPRGCMPLLKFWGYFFKEYPLTSYDVQIPKSKFLLFLEAFFMGHGIFHSTLNCTLNLSRV